MIKKRRRKNSPPDTGKCFQERETPRSYLRGGGGGEQSLLDIKREKKTRSVPEKPIGKSIKRVEPLL